MNSTKKWFDDLNDISGWHLHDDEVDALAILADEVRRQYVVPEAINAALQGSQLLTDHLRMTKLTYERSSPSRGGWPQVVQGAMSLCRRGLSPSRSVDKDG